MLVSGMECCKRDGVLGNGMWCYLLGWAVIKRVEVLLSGMGC